MKLKHQIINVERIQGVTSSVYRAFLHLMGYPQVIIIFSDDCIGLVFFWTKISSLALQTHDGKEWLLLGISGSNPQH